MSVVDKDSLNNCSQDCRRALDMDQNLIKGHFFLGLGLVEMQVYDDAIKHLQRGMSSNVFPGSVDLVAMQQHLRNFLTHI